jgi:hypothetical protein
MKAEDRTPQVDKLPKPVRADGAPAAPMPPATSNPIEIKGEPLIRDPRVSLPLSVLEEMTDALVFYSRQGFDHGIRAKATLGAFMPRQTPPGAAA